MTWAVLFAISIAQGLFLIFLLVAKGFKNTLASILIGCMLLIMVLTNFGYFIIRTDLVNHIPQFYAMPFGMILLLGPLFYLYSRSVIENTFSWKNIYWLHFIPYVAQLLFNLPLFLADKALLIQFINAFLAGNLNIRAEEKVIFAIQDLHLLIYLIFTFNRVRSFKARQGNTQYIVSVSSRIKWLRALSYCFTFFLVTVFSLYVFVLMDGKYNPVTNYIYTLVTSGIIYFIAYSLVLNPELISPDFTQKYKAYMQFIGDNGEKYLAKLKSLMEENKVFTDPDLKLNVLAEKIGLPSHQVSKLINEKFGKSFNEYVNEYKVREFINRINQPQYQSYTIYGIALDVGFNSKSSFNTAFKKITGKTPSGYKTNS
jgi:AraC-like DNA-binding protein